MAPTATTAKKTSSKTGAPSQYGKGGRKGKAAWRKNIDLDEVDEGMDELRKEETLLGVTLQKQPNEELFTMDGAGDAEVRRKLPPKKLTHAQKILAQRSAVPAIRVDRQQPTVARRTKLTYQQRERLMRVAGRTMKGPFGIRTDPREKSREGVGLQQADENPDGDLWLQVDENTKLIESLQAGDQRDYISNLVKKPTHKPPKRDPAYQSIALKPVVEPHDGTSYNPTADAHLELLKAAVSVEEDKERRRLKDQAEMERARKVGEQLDKDAPNVDPKTGMVIDKPESDEEEEESEVKDAAGRKLPKRKTKRAKKAAVRLKIEKHALMTRLKYRRLQHSLNFAKQVTKGVAAGLTEREALAAKRQKEKLEQFRDGLAGKRLGSKFKVQPTQIDVQLSEDLSESLRAMKVEGNLFRDRFLNMQQRGLIEARGQTDRSRKQKPNYKVIERRAWKEFDQRTS